MAETVNPKSELTSKNWFGKASAGLILGFTLAIGLCGLFACFGPGSVSFDSGPGQFTMWLTAPLWSGILSFCFFFRDGWRAWGWLGLANVIVWGVLFAVGFAGF